MTTIAKSRLGVCGAVAAAVILIAPIAASAATFDFSFDTLTGYSGSGVFTSSDVSSPFHITMVSGFVSDPNVNMGVASAITGIDTTFDSPNNLLSYPVPPALTYLTGNGISFDTASAKYNLAWDGGDGIYELNQSIFIFGNFTVTETPLPAALPLFAGGLGVLGLLGWRRKRKAAAGA
jgi:hypothetical protein